MRAIVILFDSLNKKFLPEYGDELVKAKNFKRLAQHTLTYENSYVSSLPCIPARRDLHTGRCNFLHREWGPLEPFDNSVFQVLKEHQIYTHLISDHYNYWEEGGCNYHTKYNSFEFVRGQEGDRWAADITYDDIEAAKVLKSHDGKGVSSAWTANLRTRMHLNVEDKTTFPQHQVFTKAKDFLHKNAKEEHWVLQIESFSPHEPFLVPKEFTDLYDDTYTGKNYDWPRGELDELDDENVVRHMQTLYRSLISMADEYLGGILDIMDMYDMWNDTMLIVGSDHGILLGEHGYWSKNIMPCYNEIANTPFHIYDPTCPKKDERRSAIIQMIDWAPTLLDYFQIAIPEEMMGISIRKTIAEDHRIRKDGIFGVFSSHINIVNENYIYMHAALPELKNEIYNYTLMPSHMFKPFSVDEMREMQLVSPLPFTKGYPVLKIPAKETYSVSKFGNLLFNNIKDRAQLHSINDEVIVKEMKIKLIDALKENDCPEEQYIRYGFKKGGNDEI